MRKLLFSLFVLSAGWLALPGAARACPLCQEAVPSTSGAEEEDQARLARAYNRSIYLMLGMPYFLVGVVGFLVYRSLRERAALEQQLLDQLDRPTSGEGAPAPPGGDSCPFSPAGTSSPVR
jgi:hypothetical protein